MGNLCQGHRLLGVFMGSYSKLDVLGCPNRRYRPLDHLF
jgi:hypothetical protein